jgi:periplasmic divalent cation tolerance protein
MSASHFVIFSTFPGADIARTSAKTLVEEKLAACANILPQVESIYHWKGKIETGAEVMVLFKTTRERYAEFEQRLRALHPYEVPEIVALELTAGLPAYLDWIADSVS